jgi:hypothetical protein
MEAECLTLGELIARARARSGRIADWLADSDPLALARLEGSAARAGESLGRHVSGRLARFCREADEEAWANALSRARDGADPGRAFLLAALAAPEIEREEPT